MATESVTETETRTPPSTDDLLCKCQQVAGVIATIAQSGASPEEIKNALWGALSLANDAADMAGTLNDYLIVEPTR